VRFDSDGTIQDNSNNIFTQLGTDLDAVDHTSEWWSLNPVVGVGANYDIRCASLVSGSWDVQAAVVGTWISLSANREWHENRTGGKGGEGIGTDQCIANFEIRDASSLVVLASFEVDCSATR